MKLMKYLLRINIQFSFLAVVLTVLSISASTWGKGGDTVGGGILPKTEEASMQVESCRGAAARVHTLCLEETNPAIISGAAKINTLMSGMELMNVNSVCAKQSKALELAKAAMTGFAALCSGAKYLCDKDCSSALTATKEAQASINEVSSTVSGAKIAANDQPIVTALEELTTKAIVGCKQDTMTLVSGAVGIANLVNKISKADQCQQETKVDCVATPADPKCKVVAPDCNKTENDTKIECICLKAPRTAGCPGADASSLAASTMNSSTNQNTSTTRPGAVTESNLSFGSTPTMSSANLAPTNSGGSGGGGPAGGGASGSGNRGADASAKSGVTQKSLVNPNILSGDSGGGGGGGGGGYRSGSGSSSSDSSSAYKAYLPGGTKDPSRSTASAPAAYKDITGSGGENNWSKVSNRYRDNKPTLMGE